MSWILYGSLDARRGSIVHAAVAPLDARRGSVHAFAPARAPPLPLPLGELPPAVVPSHDQQGLFVDVVDHENGAGKRVVGTQEEPSTAAKRRLVNARAARDVVLPRPRARRRADVASRRQPLHALVDGLAATLVVERAAPRRPSRKGWSPRRASRIASLRTNVCALLCLGCRQVPYSVWVVPYPV